MQYFEYENQTLTPMRTPLFYLSAALLCCNDFVWKSQFHNALTGKISDFAGIALWVLFWEAWLPQRFRAHLYVMSALFFVWFKSPLSESFLQLLHLGRVVDYTDLWALLVLLPLYFLDKKTDFVRWKPTVAGSVFALFLFGATSPGNQETIPFIPCQGQSKYGVKQPKDSILAHIRTRYPTQHTIRTQSNEVLIGFRPNDCEKGISVQFYISSSGADSTTISLNSYTSLCPESLPNDTICAQIRHKIIPSFY